MTTYRFGVGPEPRSAPGSPSRSSPVHDRAFLGVLTLQMGAGIVVAAGGWRPVRNPRWWLLLALVAVLGCGGAATESGVPRTVHRRAGAQAAGAKTLVGAWTRTFSKQEADETGIGFPPGNLTTRFTAVG